MPESVVSSHPDPTLARLLHHAPRHVAESFTAEQLHGLSQALTNMQGATRHRVERRHSFSILGRKYYWVLLFGRDQRTRRRAKSLTGKTFSPIIKGLSAAIAASLLAAVSLSVAYILISGAIGIELFPDRPPAELHQIGEINPSAPEN
ncbi:hypothetical protein GS597_04710 [Synechococcales cyanobacterium C]|uniref:Uncharacterized protein n=1 Tax=Petrachloros mirabilis ULC683 TaxID=2781853 RepID=A0A8K1ZXB7_9CYAN|nr:hypothetical protein [Petrachloros mirabilis]NCJ05821.1 hypothetical protein [Petrachloros mirabilis ULC683]